MNEIDTNEDEQPSAAPGTATKTVSLDRIDLIITVGLAVFVSAWAFLWAYPFPHPDAWPFLSALRGRLSLSVLGCLGKVGLGLFAAIVYLLMRSRWLLNRDFENDDESDAFFFTRFAPLCASAALTCLSYVWRAGQFLTPGWLLALTVLLGFLLWQLAHIYDSLLSCFLSYLLFAVVAGLTPVGLLALVFVGVVDTLRRWQDNLAESQMDGDRQGAPFRLTEAALSIGATGLGVAAALAIGAVYTAKGVPSGDFINVFLTWWRGWMASFWPVLKSSLLIALALATALIFCGLALGRRIRATHEQGRVIATVLAGLLAFVSLLTVLRAVDRPERQRLELVGEYIRQTALDAADAWWFFSDGRFDDAIRFELRRMGRATVVLDALNAPTDEQAKELRTLAPEPGDRDLFEAGGAGVFKAWVKERPDRLAHSVWQLGGTVVRRFGTVKQQTGGFVMKRALEVVSPTKDKRSREFAKFAKDLLALMEKPAPHGIPFGGVDQTLAAKCDAVLWRVARQAGERVEELASVGEINASMQMRQLMQRLDACNFSLRAQGEMLERLLPTANLVLTSREALEIALRRADFFLALRYANDVLVSTPNDPFAHFALGMYGIEIKDYRVAVKHFEQVLKVKPGEPAVMNNISLAYLKLGEIEKAKEYSQRAAKANPKNTDIQSNLAEILKAGEKAAKEMAK